MINWARLLTIQIHKELRYKTMFKGPYQFRRSIQILSMTDKFWSKLKNLKSNTNKSKTALIPSFNRCNTSLWSSKSWTRASKLAKIGPWLIKWNECLEIMIATSQIKWRDLVQIFKTGEITGQWLAWLRICRKKERQTCLIKWMEVQI